MSNRGHFIHLHTHSHYSLLDGLSKVNELVNLAKQYEMPAMAITDHGAMYSTIEFYKLATAAGIKPIIGIEGYVANRTRFDKEAGIDNKRFHLTLLAKSEVGYRNLVKLTTLANLEGYYYKPRMDKDLLRECSEGVIALSGCPASELGRPLMAGDIEKGEMVAREYQEIFGKGNYFLEMMQHHTVENIDVMTRCLVELSEKLKIPLVATQDSHHPTPAHARAHKVLCAISTNSDLGDTGIFNADGDDYSFISSSEAAEKFRDFPGVIEQTLEIANMVDFKLELGKWVFPDLKLPNGRTPDDELRMLADAGFAFRGVPRDEVYTKRLDYELSVIKQKGYAPYFLVVADLLRYARENSIYTTVRGSVAGSLTTYLTGITNVDPIDFKLPFERFLNPERPSAPDIDMDYADNRREEVLEYAKRKYGVDKVAQIGTFGTMMARGSVRDVARALGKPYEIGDRIAKLIPMGSQGFPMTIEHALELEPDLKKLRDTDREVAEIIDVAQKLEGCVRHVSVHAAGVVISPQPLTDFTPLQYDPKGGKIITQYDMYSIEDAGLLKFDFLGIRNLAILGEAVRLVKQNFNIQVELEKIPLDDKKTFKILAHGETIGLFQLNGSGMTKYLMDLKPTTIHDINAMVALYRPGPLESIPKYIERKHNPSLVSYLDPRMKEILEMSHGVITYQDDVMMIAIKLAGYSWLDADKLRKAMGKKIPAEMAAQKEKLLTGFVANGMTEKKAQELWELIEPFAAYGFNKAHAASYGRVAYQTAYMKANYPSEYMTAVLTMEAGDTEKVAEIIQECKRMGIPVLPPDINESFSDFTVVKGTNDEPDQIRFGLYTIKNLGEAISDAIIAERNKGGKFTSFADLLERVAHKDLNKKSLESLIRTGAFDSLGEERGALLYNIDDALEYHKIYAQEKSSNQDSLFGAMGDKIALPRLRLRPAPEVSQKDRLMWEKELLGLYISGHPLEPHREKFEKSGINIKRTLEDSYDGNMTIVGGIIESLRETITKKGERMAFVKVSDFTGSIEVVVFPGTLNEHKDLIAVDQLVVIKGRFSKRNDMPSVVADKLKALA